MEGKKRGAPNGNKRRPQSIEKMRRSSQPTQRKKQPGRGNYSDGFITYNSRPEKRNGDNIYNFRPETETKRRPQKNTSARRKNIPPVKKTKTAKTRRPRQKKPVSRAKLRLRRFILSFSAVSVVILIGIYLSLTVWFKTENLRVEGETRYTAERVLEACPINIGENIFLADKRAAAQAVKNALPYVESAEVRFSIPDTIIVKVTDAVPAYQIGVSDGYCAISAEGRILEKINSKLDSVPAVECSGLETSDVGAYVRFSDENVPGILSSMVSELETLDINDITVIDITNVAQIKLFYDNRILIVVGVPEDINYKLRTAMAIINDKLDPNNSGTITGRLDVSVCNETKKSYFNENEVYTPPSQTQPGTAAVTDTTTDPSAETDGTEPENLDNIDLSDPAE